MIVWGNELRSSPGTVVALTQSIHDNWIFDCKVSEGMSWWQTRLEQSAHAGVPALESVQLTSPFRRSGEGEVEIAVFRRTSKLDAL